MTDIPPPDRPTQQLRPGPPPLERERLVERHDPLLLERLEDAVSSLRTALAIVGVLAAAALGVAIYAVIQAEEENDGRAGASSGRVADLDDRVDRLSRQVREVRAANGGDAESGDLESLRGEISDRATKAQVDALSAQVEELADTGSGEGTSALEQRVDTLADQVEDLQNAPAP